MTGLFIVLMAIPVRRRPTPRRSEGSENTGNRSSGVTYALWALTVIHLLLLDGFKPFGAATGDGDPVFHQRFYQAVAISLPLVILRIPPVKRWVISKRASGQQWKVWLLVSVIAVPYLVGFIYIINEEILTGMMCLTMHPPANSPAA